MTNQTNTHSSPATQEDAPYTKPKLDYRFLLSGPWIGGFVFCIIFAIGTFFLGDWQMDRRMQALDEINKIVDNYDAEPKPYSEAGELFSDYQESGKWTPVMMRGSYLVEDTLLARNRPRAGQPGYEVLVPFQLVNGDVVLVDRGWLPTGSRADQPNDVPAPPGGEVQIIARVIPGEATIDRGAPEGQVASINLTTIDEELGYEIAGEAYGLMAVEQPEPAVTPEQMPEPERDEGPHLSYSLQWFTFGLMSFVVWGYLARQRAVQNREDEMLGQTEEQGFISAHRLPRPTVRKRRRDGSKTDEEIEDEMQGF